MTPKEQYRILCEQETTIPLFLQYWWMEAVCMGKQWDVMLCTRNGEIVAAMPYVSHSIAFSCLFQGEWLQGEGTGNL